MNKDTFIGRLKEGDEAAFKEMLEIHQTQVLNICYKFLLNREDAEDIAQEIFVEAFFSIKKFREESNLGTWLNRIAVNKSIDELRKKKRLRRISSFGKIFGLEQIRHHFADPQRPDQKIEQEENMNKLLKLLDKLPEKQRIALTLSKVEGYTNSEVAEIMQMSKSVVEALVYRARKSLSKVLINED